MPGSGRRKDLILIIGGEGAGKRSFARMMGYKEEDMADGIIDGRPVLFHLERMIFAQPDQAEELFDWLLGKEVVICNEVGSGIIPVDRRERLGREAAGRICVRLAQRADAVVRLVCGCPVYIKGGADDIHKKNA